MPRYQCVQFGSCPKADACEKIEIKSNELFKCPRKDPSCRQQLVELRSWLEKARQSIQDPKPGRPSGLRIALISVTVAALIGLGVWRLWPPPDHIKPPTVEQLLTEVWPWLRSGPG